MKKMRGCDASNMFDEEIAEAEREFSDDELERSRKKAKKGLSKRGGEPLEEGEISEHRA